MFMKKIFNKSALFLGALALATPALAEVLTFGGDAEQFKGDGDLVPPECTLDLPSVASAPFFVKWDCSDNSSPKDDLRSELWVKPKGENISRKVKDFLGFPASIEVNEGLLKSLSETAGTKAQVDTTSGTSTDSAAPSFEDYFPAEFRLIVRDRGGASAISQVRSVLPGTSLTCGVSFKTQSVEASGDSTGVPSLEATASSVDGANSGGGLQSITEFSFSTCEIDELCKDNAKYSFSVSEAGDFTLISSNTSYTGTGELTTGDTGTSTYTGTVTTSDSGELNVEVSCQ